MHSIIHYVSSALTVIGSLDVIATKAGKVAQAADLLAEVVTNTKSRPDNSRGFDLRAGLTPAPAKGRAHTRGRGR
jgi:hypothetical protein